MDKPIDEIIDLGPTVEKELLKETEETLRIIREHPEVIIPKRSSSSKGYEPKLRTYYKKEYFFFGKLK